MNTRRHTLRTLVAATALACALGASAQTWPDKTVKFIVPLPPGGPSEIVLRSAMEKMQATLKQPLVLENKPGAAGNLGAAEVARATPDGYTWLFTTDTLFTVNPHVYEKLAFKTGDLQPVMRASAFSQTLVCNPALGVKTVADLVRRAKEKQVSYASGGAGSPGHLSTEQFKTAAGIQMLHIPYKGPAPAMQDVIGGQVDCGFLAGPTVLPHVRSGKLVALAVSGSRRSSLLPEVPTVAESGYPGFDLFAGAVRAQGHARASDPDDACGDVRGTEVTRRGGEAASERSGGGDRLAGRHGDASDERLQQMGRGGAQDQPAVGVIASLRARRRATSQGS